MTEVLRAVGEAEPFTDDERARLAPYFTNLDGVLFFDRMKSFDTLTFLDEFGRYWNERAASVKEE